jgi:hypothetical protein
MLENTRSQRKPNPDNGGVSVRLYMRALFPWVATLAVALAATSPLLLRPHHWFARHLVDETVLSPWIYDWVAERLRHGGGLDTITEFGYPLASPRMGSVVTWADAALFAPVAWWLDFPAQWNVTEALAVFCNALAMAWLARATGARGWGTFMAGALGALCPQVWKEMAWARPNAFFPGFAVAALAALLDASRCPRIGGGRAILTGAAAVALGCTAAAVYPPTLALLAPAGLVLLVPRLRTFGAKLHAGVPVVLAGILASPTLVTLLTNRVTNAAYQRKGTGCPAADLIMPLSHACSLGPTGLGASVPLLLWILAFLALRDPSRRRAASALILLSLLYLLGALGPCPMLTEKSSPWVSALSAWIPPLAVYLTDLNRLAVPVWMQLSLLGGWGLDALPARWGPGLRVLVLIPIAAGLVWSTWLPLYDRNLWHEVPTPTQVAFLKDAGPGIAANLPFGPTQFFLGLGQPDRVWVNPLVFESPDATGQPFVDWLLVLGSGQVTLPTPPSLADASASGVRFVFFDRGGCVPGIIPLEACARSVEWRISELLGPPTRLSARVSVWTVEEVVALNATNFSSP